MKYTYVERIVFTKEDVDILKRAKNLLAAIYSGSVAKGEIENLAGVAIDSIDELLSDEYSDTE